jgi:predicted nucleic acid-binding protein
MLVVDANVWISYYLPSNAQYRASRKWLKAYLLTRKPLIAPTIILPEIGGSVARQSGNTNEGQKSVSEFLNVKGLQLVDVTEDFGKLASDIAADLRLKGADAVYVAVAQRLSVPLITWDREILNRAASAIQVQTP